MLNRIRAGWSTLRSTYWFIPALLMSGAISLALVLLQIDEGMTVDQWRKLGWVHVRDPQGARDILGVIAGSTVTVAGVVFSITIVALTMASNQFGTRVLRTFVRDTANQVVLGIFVGTFVYCVLVMRRVQGADSVSFVPYLSLAVAIALAILSGAVLIYFIHHIVTAIQAENVVASIESDLQETIWRMFPKELGLDEVEFPDDRKNEKVPIGFDEESAECRFHKTGYIQAIKPDDLLSLATKEGLIVRIERSPGDFVQKNALCMKIWPRKSVTQEVQKKARSAFVIGTQRTYNQDVDFGLSQLTAVAIRALSPGLSDHPTAKAAIDRLGAALVELGRRRMPSPYRYDEGGSLRVIAKRADFKMLASHTLDPLREYARSNAAITNHLLQVLQSATEEMRSRELREALLDHMTLIVNASTEALQDLEDKKRIES